DSRAVYGLGLDAMHLEHLLQPFDMTFGLSQVLLEAFAKLGIRCLVDHLGKVLHYLLFRIVDIAKRVDEEIVHGFDVLGKNAHHRSLSCFFFKGRLAPDARPVDAGASVCPDNTPTSKRGGGSALLWSISLIFSTEGVRKSVAQMQHEHAIVTQPRKGRESPAIASRIAP